MTGGVSRSNGYQLLRQCADRLIALIAVILLSPIILVAVLIVISDGGPAIFRQKRLGKHARVFSVIKLRTMIVDADKYLDEAGMPTRKRTTWAGDFLRKSSIDELPQLINIVKGDMALIGPRPILPRMLPHMTERERRRFSVLPGVTGLAQVKGRNHLKWSRRFKYDVVYTQRMSLMLDLYIIWRTIQTVFKSENIAADINRDQVDDVTIRPVTGDAT